MVCIVERNCLPFVSHLSTSTEAVGRQVAHGLCPGPRNGQTVRAFLCQFVRALFTTIFGSLTEFAETTMRKTSMEKPAERLSEGLAAAVRFDGESKKLTRRQGG